MCSTARLPAAALPGPGGRGRLLSNRMRTHRDAGDPRNLVLTFDELLRRTPFAERMREILHIAGAGYHSPVDVEFTLQHRRTRRAASPQLCITILQCRPQSHCWQTEVATPARRPADRGHHLLHATLWCPQGMIRTRWIMCCTCRPRAISPCRPMNDRVRAGARHRQAERRAEGRALHLRRARALGQLQLRPGRADRLRRYLQHPRAGGAGRARALALPPEPSLGTHFFQDLLEAQIYPLALQLDDPRTVFQKECWKPRPTTCASCCPARRRWRAACGS